MGSGNHIFSYRPRNENICRIINDIGYTAAVISLIKIQKLPDKRNYDTVKK